MQDNNLLRKPSTVSTFSISKDGNIRFTGASEDIAQQLVDLSRTLLLRQSPIIEQKPVEEADTTDRIITLIGLCLLAFMCFMMGSLHSKLTYQPESHPNTITSVK